jgi:putative addiction module component (TIGR02574 family)
MTNKLPLPPPGFDGLTVEEQIDYVQSLWDRITAKQDQAPVPEWHKLVLEERLSTAAATKPWEEVRDKIRAKLRSASES